MQHSTQSPNVLLFLDNIEPLTKLPKGVAGIMYCFLRVMEENNVFFIDADFKDAIANELNIKSKSIPNALLILKEHDVIKHLNTSLYWFNPHIFAHRDLFVEAERVTWDNHEYYVDQRS